MDVPLSGMNLEKMVKGQLVESIKNADVLSMLKKMIDSAPVTEETEAIRQKLETIITQYEKMNDEEKSFFGKLIKETLSTKLASKIEQMPIDLTDVEERIQWAIWSQIYLVTAVGVVVFVLVVFFGYKLYKSIRDKEKKREEKKKQKQLKKKK